MLQAQEILVERYQLQRVLGESASRQTWLARDLTNQEQVVVKLLTASDQLQWDNLRLFEREAKVLRQLDHPYIPEYRDDFVVDRDIISFALVQEYINAKSLKELLADGKIFSETEVRQIGIAVLKILIYLHKLSPGFVRWLQQMTEPNVEYRFVSASSALKALEINQLAITGVSKDIAHTPISVRKSLDKLSIHIPSNQNAIALIVGGVGLSIWMYFWIYFISSKTAIPALPSIWMYTWLILGILFTAWWTLPGYVESKLDFDNQNFEIKWKLFGFTVRKERGVVSDIDKVYSTKTGRSESKQVHEVTLSLGVNEYYFGRFKKSLSQEESRYVASEIRNWLGI